MNTLATKKLFEFITKYDLPLCIHNNITAPWVSDYPKFLHEMESIIREFPKARVILAHCWASRRLRAPYYTKMISRLLREYPWLYVDFSWVVFDEIISVSESSMHNWAEMTENFSDRIMIGSDVLWDAFEQIGVINARYNDFLDILTPETRQKVCVDNAISIYSHSKNKVEKNKARIYPTLEYLNNSISSEEV
jgi:predicted TIM-barrel fold metal-dependent hydrolase